MIERNQSPQKMFFELALENKPTNAFTGATREDFESWKADTLPKVIASLGDFPEKVPLNPEMIVEWERDGVINQRWMIDVGRHMSASVWVSIPKGLSSNEKRPAILCWHGHSYFGKDNVMGNDSSVERSDVITGANYDYGRQMAQKGFITYAIDWIGKGEQGDCNKPHYMTHNWGGDWCNIYYLHATMLGMTSLSIIISHGKAATDLACTLPNVDPERLGVMGLSGGGTMTIWSTLLDERMKASENVCYSDLWPYFGMRDINYCGMQITPGLFKLVNLSDLQGLIAPRPLLVSIGVFDTCFKIDNSLECFRGVERIYKASGEADKLELDLFPEEHSWGGNKSEAFFNKYL